MADFKRKKMIFLLVLYIIGNNSTVYAGILFYNR